MNDYNEAFFDAIRDGCIKSAAKVVPCVMAIVKPGSVIDVGCGEGWWLRTFWECGVHYEELLGIDNHSGLEKLKGWDGAFIKRDIPTELADPTNIGRRFDLAVCLEVAEHLDASQADALVEYLCGRSDVVLFSAAIPGQGGVGHVNEQWPEYWIQKFNQRGFIGNGNLRKTLWEDPDVENWYSQNLYVFANMAQIDPQRRGGEYLRSWMVSRPEMPRRVIHPRLWAHHKGVSL